MDFTQDTQETARRPRFGSQPNQDMPLEWAEKGLCWLYRERRQVFADMMLHVMDTGLTTRPARNGNGQR